MSDPGGRFACSRIPATSWKGLRVSIPRGATATEAAALVLSVNNMSTLSPAGLDHAIAKGWLDIDHADRRLTKSSSGSPVRSARLDATAMTYAGKSAVVNAPGMAPLNKAASAGFARNGIFRCGDQALGSIQERQGA